MINDPTKLKKSLTSPYDDAYETDAGYILLRYLAKQSATTFSDLKFHNGIYWSNDKSTVVLSSQYTQSKFDANSYSNLKKIDASSTSKNITLKGNKLSNIIEASAAGSTMRGMGGNDVIYAGDGVDTIEIALGDGTDTIYGLSEKDKLKIYSGSMSDISASNIGNDVIITVGNSNAILKQTTGNIIQVADIADSVTKYVLGSKVKGNIFIWKSGVNYIGSDKVDTLKVTSSNITLDLRSTKQYQSIDVLDVSSIKRKLNVYLGNRSLKFTANDVIDYRIINGKGVITTDIADITLNDYSKGTININEKIYSASNIKNNLVWNSGKTTVYIYNGYKTDVALAYFSAFKSVNTIDATNKGGYLEINANDNVIKYGSSNGWIKGFGGQDKIYLNNSPTDAIVYIDGGEGDDTIYFGKGKESIYWYSAFNYEKGNDTIYNFSSSDKIKFVSDSLKSIAAVSTGTDVVITTANGGKGNDKIYAGAGADIIKFAAGDGKDIIYNYTNSKDTIRLTSGSVTSYSISNGNGVIKTNNGTITLSGYKGSSVYVIGVDGKKVSYKVASSSYQSTLGYVAYSVSVVPPSSAMNISSISQVTSVGTMMATNGSQSELSALKKNYM